MTGSSLPPESAAPMADVRVVVVDDQLDAADMLAAALELDGYQHVGGVQLVVDHDHTDIGHGRRRFWRQG